jgi:hypothetical protein
MTDLRDEFLSEEDLDLRNLSQEELIAYWNLWLEQAQATNDLDEALYSHGVFERDPTSPPGATELTPAGRACGHGPLSPAGTRSPGLR